MFLIERVSNALASKIALALNLDKDREEVIAYGAFALLQTLWSITLVMIFGIFFNVFYESLAISFVISLLRKYSGGAHSSSPNRCAVIGAIFSTLLALAGRFVLDFLSLYQIAVIVFLSFVISYLIIYRLAPVDSQAKPIKKPEKRRKLKKSSLKTLSFLLLATIVLGAVYYIYEKESALTYGFCICLGVIWQAFTLTKPGHLILGTIDKFFRNMSI